MIRSGLYFLWLGCALATLFFYPLISALSDAVFYLQWQPAHTAEFLLLYLLVAVLLGGLLALIDRLEDGFLKTLSVAALCLVPFASFAIQIVRQLRLVEQLKHAVGLLAGRPLIGLPLALIAIGTGLYATYRWAEPLGRALLMLVLIISPLTAFGALAVARHGFVAPTIAIERDVAPAPAEPPPDLFVLVWDELDYGFLYLDGEVREAYPNIRAFAAGAENHHNARAPGDETLTSMVGLVIGRNGLSIDDSRGVMLHEVEADGTVRPLLMDGDNVFASARNLGYRTAIYGWMHLYCEMMGEDLDRCRSFSNYNFASVNDSWSLLNPLYTNIVLLPHQPPFGLAKNPIYSSYQHRLVSQTYDLAVEALDDPGPLFQVVHFSIPHLPFVYDGDRYRPARDPFLQNAVNYERQLRYVDHLFGRYVAELERRDRFDSARVLLLSDHAYRVMREQEDWTRVPLIVKRGPDGRRRDIDEPTRTEIVLRELLEPPGG